MRMEMAKRWDIYYIYTDFDLSEKAQVARWWDGMHTRMLFKVIERDIQIIYKDTLILPSSTRRTE